jgi:hypothetical protein
MGKSSEQNPRKRGTKSFPGGLPGRLQKSLPNKDIVIKDYGSSVPKGQRFEVTHPDFGGAVYFGSRSQAVKRGKAAFKGAAQATARADERHSKSLEGINLGYY